MSGGMLTSSVTVWIGDEGILSVEELAAACGVEANWIQELVDMAVLSPKGSEKATWRFGAGDVRRVRTLVRLMRDFETNLETAAVILDLLEETERLRAQLRRAGLLAD
ncbi:chaperone modulator CbpM [Methylocaldum szegediense]|uniref:Chaperone modulatory protein CbpM n=1 Tax=Methylocaldum szegediense TaxID=73780 RepID=A0ABN8X0R6_9GAMM|nr:chaperone modulator CbpM [Methylocaldum szegediense]CAI8791028.1 chaperone modulatory protein CbpM [Methylocaldum szegediense]